EPPRSERATRISVAGRQRFLREELDAEAGAGEREPLPSMQVSPRARELLGRRVLRWYDTDRDLVELSASGELVRLARDPVLSAADGSRTLARIGSVRKGAVAWSMQVGALRPRALDGVRLTVGGFV